MLGAAVIRLVDVGAVALGLGEARFHGLVLIGNQRRQPVFVGEAEPTAGRVEFDRRGAFEVGVFVGVLQRAVEDADRSDMQEIGRRHRHLALARDQGIGEQRHCRARGVRHGLRHREHIVAVDAEAAGEGEARAIVPGEIDRMIGRELAARAGPERIGSGNFDASVAAGDPTELDRIGLRGALGREQHDLGAVRIGGLAVADERQIVELAAYQIDRAGEARRVDFDARSLLQHGLARRGRRGSGHSGAGRGRGRLRRRGLTGLRGRHRRRRSGRDEILEPQQDHHRDHDREDEVFLLIHVSGRASRCSAATAPGHSRCRPRDGSATGVSPPSPRRAAPRGSRSLLAHNASSSARTGNSATSSGASKS